MKSIYEYILLPLSERQAHLRLNEPCFNRGGGEGGLQKLLAYVLDTTIPNGKGWKGNKIHVCHACNTRICDNCYHLYWGTARENSLDAVRAGQLTVRQRIVAKYGIEGAKAVTRGRKNSQFGKVWINKDGKEQKIRKNSLEEFLKEGWQEGRTYNEIRAQLPKNTVWVTDGKITYRIGKSEPLPEGFRYGMKSETAYKRL